MEYHRNWSESEEVVFRESATGVEKFHFFPSTYRVTTDGDNSRFAGHHRWVENEVPPTLRGDTRHPVGIGEVQRPHGEPPERQSRARGGPRAPHSGHARRPRFLERCDPAHLAAACPFESPCAPVMSTPFTPSGAPSRLRPDFNFESPVNQSAPTESTRGNRDHHYNERPTHEDDHGNISDAQCNPNNSRMNNSASRPSSSPKVPIFDGTVSTQFRPWIIQFEAIARHQCWTLGERVVRLVASLTGPAANLLIGMTMGQLDDYAFLVARLSRRYDPPEHEEAHRAELRARTRRRNETAD